MIGASQYIAGVIDTLPHVGAMTALDRLQAFEIQAERKLLEASFAFDGNFVDPRDATLDPNTGEYWTPLGSGAAGSTRITTIRQLDEARNRCRNLAESNPYAINGHENRINYIVGTGHKYSASAKKGREIPPERVEEVQREVDAFVRLNRWQQRQQEIVRRRDRDGECFLRLFRVTDGQLRVRFVEPSEVKQRDDDNRAEGSWGIESDPDDVETVLGYWIGGELIDVGEIQHRKRGADFNAKRGIPLFDSVVTHLRSAERLLRNMSAVAEIQTAIAMIRKYQGTSSATIASQIAANATASVTNTATAQTTYFRRYEPGTILDASANMDYQFPAAGIDASRYVLVLQARLRAIASMLVMPEFMLSSDASNANYSSTMVAEGPAVKHFERLQWEMIEDDLEIIDLALAWAVEAGRLDAALIEDVEIVAMPPRLISRDRAADTQADMALVDGKVMSKHTAAERQDLDPDAEAARIAEEAEESMARMDRSIGFGGPPAARGGQQNDEEEDDEEEDDDQ